VTLASGARGGSRAELAERSEALAGHGASSVGWARLKWWGEQSRAARRAVVRAWREGVGEGNRLVVAWQLLVSSRARGHQSLGPCTLDSSSVPLPCDLN
jgi:hypothetical protein